MEANDLAWTLREVEEARKVFRAKCREILRNAYADADSISSAIGTISVDEAFDGWVVEADWGERGAFVNYPIQCQKCKELHWTQYSCAEAGWRDEEGWHPRPLGMPLPVEHKPPVEHSVVSSVEHLAKGRHKLKTEELRLGGLNSAKTRQRGIEEGTFLSKKERSAIGKKAAIARWDKNK